MATMLTMRMTGALMLAAFAVQSPAQEHQHEQDCAAARPELPAALSGWGARGPLAAATTRAGLASAHIVPGKAFNATLKPTPDVSYVTRPEKPGGPVSYGGLFELTVTLVGTYRVALGTGAWIDVLQGRKPVISSAHGHGPPCSGIRKMVDFPLKPGRYTIQIAANGAPELAMMIAKLP